MNTATATPSANSLVRQLKQSNQDFEWYPTTSEILAVIKSDINLMIKDLDLDQDPSILDCGAGDGRSLLYLTKGSRYAIEKARPLITVMDRSIFVVGADFYQQTLLVDILSHLEGRRFLEKSRQRLIA